MSERERLRPFTGDGKNRVKLANPPLRLVLCQLVWPELVQLQGNIDEIARQFGLAIADYPIFSEYTQANVVISPEGASQGPSEKVYQWRSIDDNWHVILGHRFLSFYCTTYSTFKDFCLPLEKILKELAAVVKVPLVERVGVRYVNQVIESNLIENLSEYIHPQVLGFAGIDFATGQAQLEENQNQVVIRVEDAVMQVRSGLLPPGKTVDPAIPPHSGQSWVLDLDATIHQQTSFDVNNVLASAGKLADINYDFFKYVTSEGFLKEFGSEQ